MARSRPPLTTSSASASRARKRRKPPAGRRGGEAELRELVYDGVEATLIVAACAWCVRVALDAVFGACGLDPEALRDLSAERLGLGDAVLRLVLFTAVLAGIVPRVWAGWRWVRARLRADVAARLPSLPSHPTLATARSWARALAHVGVAALMAVLLLQPTLVGTRVNAGAWLERAANFVDGAASSYVVDSVVRVVRWFDPVLRRSHAPVDAAAFDATLDSRSVPLMDRWDPLLLEATGGDRELFAQTKAFMWVESGGRQYALSATGCAGLMQFCATTAQRNPFGAIFGAGQVASCGCDDCSVPMADQIALETDPTAVERLRDTFPCDLSDARFDGQRSILASVAYVRELSAISGGQLPIMYVGYNAGPAVAKALRKAVGADDDVTIDELRPHLANALRPYHGARAEPRANGLLEVHLPKLEAAYRRWR